MVYARIVTSSVVSEAAQIQFRNGCYVLKVLPRASKEDIKKEVESIFSVKVSSINTLVCSRKQKKRLRKKGGAAVLVKTDYVKKAFVKLVKGYSLPSPFTSDVSSPVAGK